MTATVKESNVDITKNMENRYEQKYGDPIRMKVKEISVEERNKSIDSLNTRHVLNLFFKIHEDTCNIDHEEN